MFVLETVSFGCITSDRCERSCGMGSLQYFHPSNLVNVSPYYSLLIPLVAIIKLSYSSTSIAAPHQRVHSRCPAATNTSCALLLISSAIKHCTHPRQRPPHPPRNPQLMVLLWKILLCIFCIIHICILCRVGFKLIIVRITV